MLFFSPKTIHYMRLPTITEINRFLVGFYRQLVQQNNPHQPTANNNKVSQLAQPR